MGTREPSHAGSWYSSNGPTLSKQLDEWLATVADSIDGVGPIPQPGARIIIAPHAGYSYSGPCAAYAYKSWDISKAKRIFLLGPSHHYHLSTLALPTYTSYATPLSPHPLPLDTALLTQLASLSTATKFSTLSPHNDDAEHSLEMHLPYIHKMLSLAHPTLSPPQYPPLVPILVGSTSPAVERTFGTILAPYLADPENSFVISSDFCHWGSRFSYTYYIPSIPPSLPDIASPTPLLPSTLDPQTGGAITSGRDLGRGDKPKGVQIHQSIAAVDLACMCAIATGSHATFSELLQETGNTVCGRHPIGVMMAAIEALNENKDGGENGKFRFIRYERSSDVVSVRDSSVSYVSGFAVL